MAHKKAPNGMVRQTVYDAEGTAFTVRAVDAREYLASGRYFTAPPEKPEPEKVKGKKKPDAPREPEEGAGNEGS